MLTMRVARVVRARGGRAMTGKVGQEDRPATARSSFCAWLEARGKGTCVPSMAFCFSFGPPAWPERKRGSSGARVSINCVMPK